MNKELGPTRDEIADAITDIMDTPVPGTPPVWALKTLRAAGVDSMEVEDRYIKSYSITNGQTGHGEMRSDDHIGRYVIQYPRLCPECPGNLAVYSYRAHHNIAGSSSVVCTTCGHEHESDQWG